MSDIVLPESELLSGGGRSTVNVAIITARGGSKRIPRKNIRPFCGRPIIEYSVHAALTAGCFDEVMVSTDDEEISKVARASGALVPFMRSPRTSTDHATTAEVLVEVLEEYGHRGVHPETACCIYPTAPFITADSLRLGLATLLSGSDVHGAIPVVRFSYPIQRALRVRDGRVALFQPEHLKTRSQDLEPAYHDAGQFYWVRVVPFLASRNLMSSNTAAVILPEWQVQDIDTEDDWMLAEMKFQLLQARSGFRPDGGREA
jgi:N-acylneuraminate cytidylyltransferase